MGKWLKLSSLIDLYLKNGDFPQFFDGFLMVFVCLPEGKPPFSYGFPYGFVQPRLVAVQVKVESGKINCEIALWTNWIHTGSMQVPIVTMASIER